MLKNLFIGIFCMSFAGDLMAANFDRDMFNHRNFRSPTEGYALWTQVIDSFKSDEFIKAAKSENEWEESGWKTTFEILTKVSIASNLFSATWSITKRHQAGNRAQEVLDYLINNQVNNQSIINKLSDITTTSNDERYCYESDG